MPSTFEQRFRRLTHFDEHFGKPWTLRAYAEDSSTEYGSRGDGERRDPAFPDRTLVGVMDTAPVIVTTLGSGANTHENQDLEGTRTTIDFEIELFADPATQPVPRQGWTLTDDTGPGKPVWEVTSAQPDGVSRLVCKVAFKGMSA